jgi:hypothetical protein
VSLVTSTLVAGSIVLDGISVGDLEAGMRDSRHGRTLSAIFRARLSPAVESEGDSDDGLGSKQTLMLPVKAEELPLAEATIASDVTSLFTAAALACGSSLSFGQLYELKIVSYTDPAEVRC